MNRRQRQRQRDRRRAHLRESAQGRAKPATAPLPVVKQGHIVPRCYQRSFAVDEQVAVHVDDAPDPVLMHVKDAGTRSKYYRRTRPDGTSSDDFEMTLNVVEGRACPDLHDLVAGADLTLQRKATLCQLLGMQLVRGPAFVGKRAEDAEDAVLAGLTPASLQPGVLDRAEGDFEGVRSQVIELFKAPNETLAGMARIGVRVAAILGSMQWRLLKFDRPLLAYSDHPLVLWPLDFDELLLPITQQFGPLNTMEAVVPLAPDLALLMTWMDVPDDARPLRAPPEFAAQLNGLVIPQADRQWMHQLGTRVPRRRSGLATPFARQLDPRYGRNAVLRSQRRARVQGFVNRAMGQPELDTIEIVNVT